MNRIPLKRESEYKSSNSVGYHLETVVLSAGLGICPLQGTWCAHAVGAGALFEPTCSQAVPPAPHRGAEEWQCERKVLGNS